MTERTKRLSRRNFLFAAATGGAATAAAIPVKQVQQPLRTSGREKRAPGYHPTDHVKTYYRTARV